MRNRGGVFFGIVFVGVLMVVYGVVVDDSYVGRLALNGWVWVLVLVGWR